MKTILGILAAFLIMFAVTSCDSTEGASGWEAMNISNGTPVKRDGCSIHYKINRDRFTDDGVQAFGFDVSDQIIAGANEMYSLTGVRWVFDGYTHATWNGRNGTRSAQAWATNDGVLIELHTSNWSQPNPETGPVYTGGVIWYDMDQWYQLRMSGSVTQAQFQQQAFGTIRHEMGHQHGLGDLYDNSPHSWSTSVVSGNRMGTSRNPWGAGDRNGFAALRPSGC